MNVNAYRILVGKPEGKRQLGKPKRRWKNNNTNKINPREVGWGCNGLELSGPG
jgi:hypothetical protein